MLAHKLLQSAGGTPSDPNFENVVLLLHGDGTNGGQNNTFVDSSTNNFSITRNGNTTQGSLSPYGNLWSNYFDGTGDALSAPANVAFSYGTGDFTYEAWIYPTVDGSATTYRLIMGAGGPGQQDQFSINNSGTRTLIYFDGVTAFVTANQFTLNVWNHVAVSRNSGTLRIFINGVLGVSGSSTANITIGGSNTFWVGNRSGGAESPQQAFIGYISNVRVLKGVGLYTTNFTPSTAPLTAIANTSLLTCQSNRFIDNSSNNFTITRSGNVNPQRFSPFAPSAAYSTSTIGGSAYFDGSGDGLVVNNPTSATVFNRLTASGVVNTIEFWLYLNAFTSPRAFLCGSWARLPGETGWTYDIDTSGDIFVTQNGAGPTVSLSTKITTGVWQHLAFVNNGTLITIYLNGLNVGTLSVQNPTSYIGSFTVGMRSDSVLPLNGYISNFRLTNGTAVYTTNFTPPTAPVSAVTGTNLLLNFTNAAIFDNAMMNDLETVGNAQISTSVKKYGTGSIRFDGSGDWLTIQNSPQFSFGTGNFTLEFWINFSSISGYITIYSYGYISSGDLLIQTGNGNGRMIVYINGSAVITESGTGSTGTWIYYALVRNGTTLTLYRDGVSSGSATNSTDINTTEVIGIGANPLSYGGNPVGSFPLNGYIDDLRITKGVARYTANFTPPPSAFPNK